MGVSGDRVTVYHQGAHGDLAVRVLDFLESRSPLPALPDSVPSGVTAYLAPGPEWLDRLTGGVVPEWSAGVAVPSRRVLVVPVHTSWSAVGGERARVLAHEWAHLALHQHLADLRVPRWFSEGYAEWVAGWDRSEAWRLRILLATGRSPPLDSLTLGWPRDAASARMAYLLSASAVEYLVESSGERGLELFLERWRATGSLQAALWTTYALTPSQLEEHWRQHVKGRYGWVLAISHSLVFWAFLAVALVVMVRIRRTRDRERLARLRAVEGPDAPAWWEPGPGGGPDGDGGTGGLEPPNGRG